MAPVIPPKKNRAAQRTYDTELYKLRHLVEKGLPPSQTLVRNRNAIRKEYCLFSSRRAH